MVTWMGLTVMVSAESSHAISASACSWSALARAWAARMRTIPSPTITQRNPTNTTMMIVTACEDAVAATWSDTLWSPPYRWTRACATGAPCSSTMWDSLDRLAALLDATLGCITVNWNEEKLQIKIRFFLADPRNFMITVNYYLDLYNNLVVTYFESWFFNLFHLESH